MTADSTVAVERLTASVYEFPTDAPESDDTLAWDSTTMILVRAYAGDRVGLGYTYAGPAAADVITGTLAEVVCGRDALTPTASWAAMQYAVRNLGQAAVVAQASSTMDIALWGPAAR